MATEVTDRVDMVRDRFLALANATAQNGEPHLTDGLRQVCALMGKASQRRSRTLMLADIAKAAAILDGLEA